MENMQERRSALCMYHVLSRVIRDRNGAIVKTIGDAVMAVFDNPVEATSAALEMIDAPNEFNHTISQELMWYNP